MRKTSLLLMAVSVCLFRFSGCGGSGASAAVLASGSFGFGQNSEPCRTHEKISASPAEANIEISFDLHRKFAAILLRVEVNKQPAVMILDTGSSRTILDPRIAALDSREPRRPASVGKGSGVSGDDARWGKASLQIGTHLLRDRPVVVLDMQDVSHNFQQQIDGLLGQDIISEFRFVVIDFSSRKLTLGLSNSK